MIMMKSIHVFWGILMLIPLVCFQSCHSGSSEESGYTLHARIDGLDNGKVFLARLDLVTNERQDVDSITSEDGEFVFAGKVETPYLHTLIFENYKDKIHFFLENSEIDITGEISDLANPKIIGSREDSLFRSYAMDDVFDRRLGMEIMLHFPDFAFAAFTAYYQFQIHNIHPDTMEMVVNGFSESVQNSTYFFYLNELYATIKNVAIGQIAPDFVMPDTSGKVFSLNDFVGKYVLLDFWASWCAPCRAANPILVEVYNQYLDQNFIIVGISVDNNGAHWKQAIQSDQLPWINLSNLEGWGQVSSTYAVKAVPQNFLLDPDGVIIAKNIEPDNMVETLGEILSGD